MSVADIGPKWPIYCLHFLPIMRWYWLPIPLRHRSLIPCRYSLPMRGERRDKVDVDDRVRRYHFNFQPITCQYCLSTGPIVNIYVLPSMRYFIADILVFVASVFPEKKQVTNLSLTKFTRYDEKTRYFVNQVSLRVNRGCGQREAGRRGRMKDEEKGRSKTTRSPLWD